MDRRRCFSWLGLTCSVILVLLSPPASSYGLITFERAYGGSGPDGGSSVQQTLDGGYIIVSARGQALQFYTLGRREV